MKLRLGLIAHGQDTVADRRLARSRLDAADLERHPSRTVRLSSSHKSFVRGRDRKQAVSDSSSGNSIKVRASLSRFGRHSENVSTPKHMKDECDSCRWVPRMGVHHAGMSGLRVVQPLAPECHHACDGQPHIPAFHR